MASSHHNAAKERLRSFVFPKNQTEDLKNLDEPLVKHITKTGSDAAELRSYDDLMKE